uniref:Probable enoyl-CoA hydratase, mitochondrial n=1 Tax=Acrobeloides nanus TaxID=290746 RepID=A0A914E228_9BILA
MPEFIIVEKVGDKKNVGLITLNRPKVLNAINVQLMNELLQTLSEFDNDLSIGCIIITGSEKSFSVGGDIKEQNQQVDGFGQAFNQNLMENWEQVAKTRKPIIAAVNGFAIGGGCLLSMLCDIIYAGEKAQFGLPEVKIGTIPAIGGSQRLPRVVGKSLAMEMCLTGDTISAEVAFRSGLVSKVFPPEKLVEEAIKLGEKIAAQSQLIAIMGKEAVNRAYESTLQEGLHFERRMFCATLPTNDCKEGLTAFIENRKPEWKSS